MTARMTILLAAAALLIAGCGAPAGQTPGTTGEAPVREPTRTLITVVRIEPVSLASRALQATGAGVGFSTRLFNAGLTGTDLSAVPQLYLAESLPQLNTDTWRVFPDGRMETTYRLKPNILWHDGAPLSPEDFAFALRVYLTPEFGLSRGLPQRLIDEVAAPDSRTLVIRWKALYPEGGELSSGLAPLPRHILQDPYESASSAPEVFVGHPFWSMKYVGLGPYRLDRWEPGSFIEGVAFDAHILGRPKIDRVQLRFMADENTVLANVLAGEVHLATDRSIRYEHTEVLKRDWVPANKGVVLLTMSLVRYILFQLRPELASPSAILDPRVRRALAHATDKELMNVGVFDGEATISDTFISPDAVAFREAERLLAKYPYDPRQTERLMGEAGFRKGGDGFFLQSATGERFSPLLWQEGGSQNQKELNILLDTWHRAGVDLQSYILPAAQLSDAQTRASFPAMYITQGGGSTDRRLNFLTREQIPTPQNRWGGNNRGGWANDEYDRLWETFNQTLEREEANRLVAQMLKLASEDVAAIPFYFNFAPTVHVAALQGPRLGPRIPDSAISWDVHQWSWK